MEGSSKMARDPVSKMIDLAVFYMKKDATDENITSKINSLGFQIASFNETDMVVTIQHPSSSVMRKFFDIERNSETSQNMSLHQDRAVCSISNTDASVGSDVEVRSDEDHRPNGKIVDRHGNAKGIANSPVSDEKQKHQIDYLGSYEVRRKPKTCSDLEYDNALRNTTQRQYEPKIGNVGGKSLEKETIWHPKQYHRSLSLGMKTELKSDPSLSSEKNMLETFNSSSNPDVKVKNNVENVTMRKERNFPSLNPFYNKDKGKKIETCVRACSKSEDQLINDAEHEISDEIKKSTDLVFQKESQRFPDSQNVDTSDTTEGKVLSVYSEKSRDLRSQATTSNPLTDKTVKNQNLQSSSDFITENSLSRKPFETNYLPYSSDQSGIHHDQHEEKVIQSENPTGTSYDKACLKSQENVIDDIKDESLYEVISLTEPVYNKVSHKYPDLIGSLSVKSKKTGERSFNVSIKKSKNSEDLLSYVRHLDSKATTSGYLTGENGSTHSLQSSSATASEKLLRSKTHQPGASDSSLLNHTNHSAKSLDANSHRTDTDKVFEKKFENLLFQVQIKDITCLSVDVIVCPASRRLDLHSGLQKATSDAAGRALRCSCEKFIREYSSLCITDVFISPAGNLHAKEVFHAVGPYYNMTHLTTFTNDLRKTLLTCLMLADLRGFKSIAFPFISASTSESLSKCVSNYMLAVNSFDIFRLSNKNYRQTLQTVIFVDKKPPMIERFVTLVKTDWDKHATQCSSPDLYGSDFLKALLDEFNRPNNSLSIPNTGLAGAVSKLRDINSPRPSESMATGASHPFCTICCDVVGLITLICCKKKICQSCQHKIQRCPFCKYIFYIIEGNQPDGSMRVKEIVQHLPGFEGDQTYEITYYLPAGTQEKDHPNPGESYRSSRRIAYIPKSKEGEKLILRLALAFWRRLTFTISTSLTTGRDNSIVWNGIHHKTSFNSSKGSFCYPDPGYLRRLDDELNDRGVYLRSRSATNDEENAILQNFRTSLKEKGSACINVAWSRRRRY